MSGYFLFDMDGLLLDTERLFQTAFCNASAALGVACETDADFYLTLVGSSHALTEAAVQRYLSNRTDVSAFLKEWEGQATKLLSDGVPTKLGVHACLQALQDTGGHMAVVTSTSFDHAQENLQRAGLLHFFSFIKGGDQVSANKPHPAPYLEAAAEFGVSAETCFAFEDSDRGITSAVRAGCKAVQIPDLRVPDQPFPDLDQYIAKDLHDALQYLGQL